MDLINNNDLIKQFNNIIIVIVILFITIFIILFYLIHKINNIKSLEGFDTTQDITDAVNAKYDADVDAIRNLSNIAKSLATDNTFKMTSDLNVDGKITTSKDIIASGTLTTSGNALLLGNLNNGGIATLNQIKCDWINNNSSNGNLNLSSANDIHLIPRSGCTVYAPNTSVSGNLNVAGTTTVGKLVISNPQTNFQRYMLAGAYQIKAYGRCVDLYCGWTILFSDHNEQSHNVASRLSLYEKTKGTNGFIRSSAKGMISNDANDHNWTPHRLVVFPGYRVRFFMWNSECDLKYNSGYYDWVTDAYPNRQERVHLIYVTLDSDPDDIIKFKVSDLENYNWNTSVFPVKISGKDRNINDGNLFN